MEEIWKPIDGFDGYLVSNTGLVKSMSRTIDGRWGIGTGRIIPDKILKGFYNKDGYHLVELSNRIRKQVHRLVAISFIENPNEYPIINHKDGNPINNHVDNLEWCSYAYNTQHSYNVLGRIPLKGEKCGASKLKENEVIELRKIIASKLYLQKDIARVYGLSKQHISAIKTKYWNI